MRCGMWIRVVDGHWDIFLNSDRIRLGHGYSEWNFNVDRNLSLDEYFDSVFNRDSDRMRNMDGNLGFDGHRIRFFNGHLNMFRYDFRLDRYVNRLRYKHGHLLAKGNGFLRRRKESYGCGCRSDW